MTAPILRPEMNRVDLAELFAKNGYKSGAEIGTAAGAYAYTLCRVNPQAIIYCIDPWEVYEDFKIVTSRAKMERNFLKACKRLEPFSNYKIIREYSENALHKFKDESLDFVYIDANHDLPYVMDDIVNWSKKVRTGGIVSGHDYLTDMWPDVTVAVNEYTDTHMIDEWYAFGVSTLALSWYWVKP